MFPLDISPSLTASSTTPILPTPSFISTLSLLLDPRQFQSAVWWANLHLTRLTQLLSSPAMQETQEPQVWFPGQEDAWEGTATHTYNTRGRKESDMTEQPSTQALTPRPPSHSLSSPFIIFITLLKYVVNLSISLMSVFSLQQRFCCCIPSTWKSVWHTVDALYWSNKWQLVSMLFQSRGAIKKKLEEASWHGVLWRWWRGDGNLWLHIKVKKEKKWESEK